MNEKKVVLVDDELPARMLLKQYIGNFPLLQLIAECKNGIEAIGVINALRPDLVFMDIQMPGKSGFDVLQEIEYIPQIIFSTAYDTYALEAFNVNAVDYLLKPYTKERFEQALEKALQKNSSHHLQKLTEILMSPSYPKRILVELGNRLISLSVEDILWLEAEGDYTRLHTTKQSHLSNKGISELEQRLHPHLFQRVHRSAIVALSAILEVHKEPSGPQIILKNGVAIKVSRSYVAAIRNLIY